jgi:hypothetical protein
MRRITLTLSTLLLLGVPTGVLSQVTGTFTRISRSPSSPYAQSICRSLRGTEQYSMCLSEVSNNHYQSTKLPADDSLLNVQTKQPYSADSEEKDKCKAFKGTEMYRECVIEIVKNLPDAVSLISKDKPIRSIQKRNKERAKIAQAYSAVSDTNSYVQEPVGTQSASAPSVSRSATTEQTCSGYGFRSGSADFSQCVFQLDQARQQAEFSQRQYQLQFQQYQQQQAAFAAQQDAIKKERDRRKWEMLARLGAGIANSRSPSLLGAINEGMASAQGLAPPLAPPPPPPPQNYTVRLPNGNQVYCNYSAGYMSCR